MTAFKTVGDVATTMLSIGHRALIGRHLTDNSPRATYATTVEEMTKFALPKDPDGLFAYLADMNVGELCALVATGGSMIADLMLELNDGDAEAAKDSLERMMLKIRQQEVGL